MGEHVLVFLVGSRQLLPYLHGRQTEAKWVPIRAAGTVRKPGLDTTSLWGYTGQVKWPLHAKFSSIKRAIFYFKGLL